MELSRFVWSLIVTVLAVSAVTSSPVCDCKTAHNLNLSEQSCLLNHLLHIISHLVHCSSKEPIEVTPEKYTQLLKITNCSKKPEIVPSTTTETPTEETTTSGSSLVWFNPSPVTEETTEPPPTTEKVTQAPPTTEKATELPPITEKATEPPPITEKATAPSPTTKKTTEPPPTETPTSTEPDDSSSVGVDTDFSGFSPFFPPSLSDGSLTPITGLPDLSSGSSESESTENSTPVFTLPPRVGETPPVTTSPPLIPSPPQTFPPPPPPEEPTTTPRKIESTTLPPPKKCEDTGMKFHAETFFIPVLKFHGGPCMSAQELRDYLFRCLPSDSKSKADSSS